MCPLQLSGAVFQLKRQEIADASSSAWDRQIDMFAAKDLEPLYAAPGLAQNKTTYLSLHNGNLGEQRLNLSTYKFTTASGIMESSCIHSLQYAQQSST